MTPDIADYVRARWWPRRSGLLLPRWNNQFSLGGSDCGCCNVTADPCAIFSDMFDRADNSSPGADWSEENGQVAISSNKLAYVSGSDVACISTTTHTSQAVTITVDVRQTGFVLVTGTEFRVILSYTDASNYYYAALKIGTSQYLRLVQRSGGSDTVLSTTAVTTTINTTYTITACMSEVFMYATCNASGSPEVWASHAGSSGEFGVGFGTADIFSSFDNFVARAVEDSCEECTRPICHVCTDAGVADAYEVTFSGIGERSGGSCTLGDCATLNATWILTPDLPNDCNFLYVLEPSICQGGGPGSYTEIRLQFIGTAINVTIDMPTGQILFQTGSLGAGSTSCREFTDYDIPISSGGAPYCDGDTAICTVTSL